VERVDVLAMRGGGVFGEKFREMVTFPLGVKKGTDQADRVIKFIAGFVGLAQRRKTAWSVLMCLR
jgi:hypothetical protein